MLVADDGRVLLVCGLARPHAEGRTAWFAPGTMIERGETTAQAGARLLTGLGVPAADVGPPVWRRQLFYLRPEAELVVADEHYLVVRHNGPGPAEDALGRPFLWWTAAMLSRPHEAVFPERLGLLLQAWPRDARTLCDADWLSAKAVAVPPDESV
ncbi:hypothetical protein BZG35_08475 [Brevundimonas sp. LM2]|nr:hypothetical protein BZG35_08475 [Brevundimonas sp. LM2]